MKHITILENYKYVYKVNPDKSCTVTRMGLFCAVIEEGIEKAKKIFE